jgi:hypothetical protein
MIVAGVCIVVAAFFLVRRNFDTAFVIAVVGLLAWFLNYRAQMKDIVAATNLEEGRVENENEIGEESNDE